ncbi:hypothetical protein [Spiroplasma phoeniceum]|uniref:Spiroplasma plectrovirus-related protein n=1 Tax=Spiroplasma phoeniceum P40 TaxID=1276259 RepID=A0A345DNE8_9MOLU|nr:hypothetical protein [Spiroplasma phoeniceum]AXF95736.1 spiroplasma plectrovirus-related protein [Spiroplasma phoeniceum P40]
MLGMYLTTAFNFLTVTTPTPKTMSEGMTGIWTGLTSALWKVKEGITNILCRNHIHFVFLVFTVLESKFF